MVSNDDAFIQEGMRRLQVNRQQAGSYRGRCVEQNLFKREWLASRGVPIGAIDIE
jgi:hypothetical protein